MTNIPLELSASSHPPPGPCAPFPLCLWDRWMGGRLDPFSVPGLKDRKLALNACQLVLNKG